MSQRLFKAIGAFNAFLNKQSWVTAPIYWMVNRSVPTETQRRISSRPAAFEAHRKPRPACEQSVVSRIADKTLVPASDRSKGLSTEYEVGA